MRAFGATPERGVPTVVPGGGFRAPLRRELATAAGALSPVTAVAAMAALGLFLAAAATALAATSEGGAGAAAPPAGGKSRGSGSRAEGIVELRLLSYNIRGLPGWAARDHPARRIGAIAPKLRAFDLVLLQEDFAHHDRIAAEAADRLVVRGNDSRWAWARRWLPGRFGSGLTLLVRRPRAALLAVERHPYRTCAGWLVGANDCFATKGFLRARLRLAPGVVLNLVDTHLDAGRRPADRRARARQLDELTRALEHSVGERALVLAGDLNLDLDDPADAELLERFAARLRLRRAPVALDPARGWRRLDHVLWRSGPRVEILSVEVREAREFTAGGVPLSDHPALAARIALRSRAAPGIRPSSLHPLAKLRAAGRGSHPDARSTP